MISLLTLALLVLSADAHSPPPNYRRFDGSKVIRFTPSNEVRTWRLGWYEQSSRPIL